MGHRSRAFGAAVAATSIAAASVACTLLEPLDGLSEGGEPGADGAASDVTSSDGDKPGSDAGADAARPSDGDASAPDGSWCDLNAKTAEFCEDFDLTGLTRFDSVEQTGGTPMLVTVDPVSPPNALLSDGTGPGELRIGVLHGSATVTSSATLSVDVRLEKVNTAGNQPAQLLKLFFDFGSVGYEVGVGAAGTNYERYVYTYATPSAAYGVVFRGGTWPLGQWVRVTMHVALASDAGAVDVDFAGVPLAKAVPIAAPFGSATVRSEIGVAFANAGSNGWTVRMDNVVYDSK